MAAGRCIQADISDAIATMGQRFVQIYGQGKSPMTITALCREWHDRTDHPRYLERLASVGTAQSVMSVRITDAEGNPLPAGETGEIEAKGAAVMLGYWNNPKANAETLKDGWLRTGDVGRLDEDGFLTLSDRSKDVIISGGTNIYPREVEEALLTHPDVREVSAIGVPDPDWGEIVVACVVLEQGATPTTASLTRIASPRSHASSAQSATSISSPAEEQLRQGAEDGTAGDDESPPANPEGGQSRALAPLPQPAFERAEAWSGTRSLCRTLAIAVGGLAASAHTPIRRRALDLRDVLPLLGPRSKARRKAAHREQTTPWDHSRASRSST